MGLVRYHWRFVPNFNSLAAPLSHLSRKAQLDRVRWTDETEQAFQALKQALISSPVLWNPDFNLPFTIRTWSSTLAES